MAGGSPSERQSKRKKQDEGAGTSSQPPSQPPPTNTPAALPITELPQNTLPLSTNAELQRIPENMRGQWVAALQNDPKNRRFFRDQSTWALFNTNKTRQKAVSQAYYYKLPAGMAISDWEATKIEEMINCWKWKSLIECDGGYNENFIRILYANMVATTNPWGVSTFYMGEEIPITIPVITELLGIEPTGEEAQVYPVRNWPEDNDGSEQDYREWLYLDRLSPATSRSLPAVYQLGHAFINNILMPKADIKTNLEKNSVYLLRHLIMADKDIDVPYIIISHMRQAMPCHPSIASLPYGHLLTKLLAKKFRKNIVRANTGAKNLFGAFGQLGWVRDEVAPSTWTHDAKHVNLWIKQEGAAPNQFVDPNEPEEEEEAEEEQPPQTQYQPPPSGYGPEMASGSFQYPGNWAQPPPGTCENPYVQYICTQVANLSTGMMHMMANQARTDVLNTQTAQSIQNINARLDTYHNRFDNIDTRIQTLEQTAEQNHNQMVLNWTSRFGAWEMPTTHFSPDATMADTAVPYDEEEGDPGQDVGDEGQQEGDVSPSDPVLDAFR